MDLGLVWTDILASATTTISGISGYINALLGIGLGLWLFGKFRKA